MAKIEVPGVVWTLVIIAVTALVHEYADHLPGDPIYWDMAILALVGWLKGMSLDNDTISQAFAAIEALRNRLAGRQMRSENPSAAAMETPIIYTPEEPSKMSRWLWG